jgi:uncharacterized protein (DUF697 family)
VGHTRKKEERISNSSAGCFNEERAKMTESAVSIPAIDQSEEPKVTVLSREQREARHERAMGIVKKYIWTSGGVSLVPVPFFDQVAVAGVLAKMLSDLGQLYGVEWSDQKIKATVASVLGGGHVQWITYAPILNLVGAMFTRPFIAGGIAYGIGKLFVHHFETGAWV